MVGLSVIASAWLAAVLARVSLAQCMPDCACAHTRRSSRPALFNIDTASREAAWRGHPTVRRLGSPVERSIQVARPVAAAAYPADEQLPPPWAELAGAGPLGPPRRSDLYRDEAATW